MNQNNNTPYQVECYMPGIQSASSGISVFNLQQNENEIIEQSKIERKNTFSFFISSRNRYLSRLESLGNNWISGSSKQPTQESIQLSKDVLNTIGNWYAFKGYKDFIYPKILMSPTPSGGIAMEIEIYPTTRAYMSILDNNINYEVEKNGYFTEYTATKDNISNQLLTLYDSNEGRYNS